MTATSSRSVVRRLALLALGLLLAASFIAVFRQSRAPIDRLWLRAPGWSRATLIGHTTAEHAVPFAFDAQGQPYLLLVPPELGGTRPQLVALDRSAQPRWHADLAAAPAAPTAPQLVWDGTALRAFWLSNQQLYGARIATNGEILEEPRLLSGAAVVESYSAVADANGRMAAWFGGTLRNPGVYALTGDLAAPQQIDSDGIRPTLRFDPHGTLHAVWITESSAQQRDTRIAYTTVAAAERPAPSQTVLTIESYRAGDNVEGPWLGIDAQTVYLLWSATAPRSGAVFSQFASFPLGAPEQISEIQAFTLPMQSGVNYQASDGALNAGPRLTLGQAIGGPLTNISSNASAANELAVALVSQQYTNKQLVKQVSIMFTRNGAPSTYQILSNTPDNALTPYLASDAQQHLYASWRIVGQNGYRVYFASTAPDLVAALRPITQGDLARMVIDTVFGLLTGAMLAPIAAVACLVGPLLVLGVTWFLRRKAETWRDWRVYLSVGAALLAFWIIKQALLESMANIVPFAAWVPIIPNSLGEVLRWGITLLSLVLGLWIAWRVTVRAGRYSAVLFVLAYIAVDSLITMAVFGEAML
jgi:hypothetical protein